MLYLFGPKETDFVNGDSDLIHNTYDEVVERAKGFYLKFKMTLDKDEQYKKVKKEMIISAYTPDGWNQFRVFDIYNYSNHVEVVATQLHYDLNYKKVYPFNARNVTAQRALNLFVSKFKSDLPNFKFTSSIDVTRNFSTDDDLERLDEGHNALEVLNRMAARWGGELDVNGYNVRLVPKLGKFTNALLYEHKNISEFVDETSMSEVITRIHAVTRFRPERIEGSEDEPEEVTIKVAVDSPLINEYAQVYEEDYTNNNARTKAELVAWARLKYSTDSVDKPARSIKVETNIIDGQEINYGDDLVLKYTKHDVDEIIRCVGYQYNPNSRQYISVTLGSNTKTLSTTITGAVHDSTRNQFSNMEKQVQAVRYAANDKNRATTGPLPVPNPIEGDIWYYHPEGRPNEVELRIFQNGGWETIVNDLTGENIRKTIDDMELEADALAEDIAASDQKATAALEEAGISNNLAQTAKTNAANALSEASEAKTQAGKAVADALTAMDDARLAKTDASTAISNAATAHTDAQTAMSDAQSALSKADSAESSVSTLSTEVDTVAGKVALKADQTEVDTVKGTVATHTTKISQNATAISSKAESETVNKIKGTVDTHTTEIRQNAKAITSKAAQTEVDTVKGTVDTHTTKISQNATAISARLTQTQVDNLVSDKGYSTVSYVDAEMTATAGAIRTEMSAVEGKIPTEIGGRNYALGTTNKMQYYQDITLWAGVMSDNTSKTEYTLADLDAKVGDVYTASIYIGAGGGFGSGLRIDNQSGSKYRSNQLSGGYASVTFTVDSSDEYFIFYYSNNNNNTQPYKIEACKFKIEKGNIRTDWSPAPEDTMMQNDFNVFKASYDQSAEGWSTKLTQIEQAGYATKTWSNDTFATPQSITTALSSYAKKTALNGLATESYVGTQITTTAKAIRTEMTAVEEKIPTEIGGRNLIQGSSTPVVIKPRDTGVSSDHYNYVPLKVPMTKGETYTLSFNVEITHGSFNQVSLYTQYPQTDSVRVDLVNNRAVYTFTAVDDTNTPNIYIYAGVAGTTRGNGAILTEYQLEKGSVATDWSPAPEDNMKQTEFNSFKASYEQSAEGWNAKFTEVEGKIPQSYTEENLIIDSKVPVSTTNYLIKEYQLTKNLPMRKEYTIVLEGGIGATGSDQEFAIFFDGGGSHQGNLENMGGGIFKKTFTLEQTGAYTPDKSYFRLYNRPNNGSAATIKWIKLVEGKAKDNLYKPSMNDLLMENEFTAFTTDFDVKAQGWDATSTYVDTNKTKMNSLISNVDGWSSTISYVDNNKTKINNTISTVDSYVQTIGTNGEKIARLVMTDSVYQTSIRKGGRNLLKDSYGWIGNPNRAHSSFSIKDPIPHGTKVTLSFKASSGGNQIVEIYNTNAYYKYGNVVFTKGTTPHVYHLTFTTYTHSNGGSTIDVNNQQIRFYNKLEPNPTAYIQLHWAVLQYGEIGTEHYIGDDEDVETQVTQLENSWALTLKSGDDIKTQINATTSGIRLQGKTIQLDGNTTMNNAFARSLMVDKLQAADITAFTGKFHKIIANNLDVNNIAGTKSTFLESAWTGLNSRAYVDSRRIRIESGTRGAYVELNNIPEFRSQYHDGTGVVMAKGRVQFFEPNGGSQGYMGRDIHTGTNDFGIFISRGKGWRLARATDSSSSTGDKYYTVKSGATDRVGIIEDMVRRKILKDGNTQNFINNSNKIARLNGWPILPQPWPTQRVGDQILYEKGKVVNDGGTGVSYEDVMNFGKNGARTDWWLYMRQHVRFEAGYTSASDRRIKHNIQSTDIVALNEIESLDMVQFNMNSDGRYVPLGLIAQEAGILRVPDEKNEGINVELATMLSLKGVQELHQRIKELEEEVKTLKENDA